MTSYTFVLFLHLVGAIGAFIGVGIWLFVAAALRRVRDVAQVRALAGLVRPSGRLAVASILLLAAAGLYMALTVWGWQADWIVVATVSFLLLAPFGTLLLDPRLRAIAQMASEVPDGPLPASLVARTRDPLLGTGLHIYITVLLGIVFLMSNKPPLVTSILVMGMAVLLGLISGVPLWWAARIRSRDVAVRATRP